MRSGFGSRRIADTRKAMFSYPEVVYAFVLSLRWENKDMCEAAEMFDWVTLLPPEVYGSGLGRRR